MLGLILAGGKSQRFGQDKALYQLNNQPANNITLAVNKLSLLCDQILVSSNSTNYLPLTNQLATLTHVKVISDQEPYRQRGPLSGLFAASLLYPQKTDYLLLAVDYPLISDAIIGTIASHANCYATTPYSEHYAIAHFSFSADQLQNFLKLDNLSLGNFLREIVHCQPVSFPDSVLFTNYNYPKETIMLPKSKMSESDFQKLLKITLTDLAIRQTVIENQLQQVNQEIHSLEKDNKLDQLERKLQAIKNDYQHYLQFSNPSFKLDVTAFKADSANH
ncbi:molybdenum cofactor guanylyltransferase [Liquorilactobacillus satsumensis]|uniref:molybdenum cofactor guanylyltransferase n=1 Tax=Liquorilactobacillus satsumensis TaxID=259059 RepID=UPI0039ED59ED